jgi:hypothetical protein
MLAGSRKRKRNLNFAHASVGFRLLFKVCIPPPHPKKKRPMPDKAIAQHFLHKKTTADIIDGSGATQVHNVSVYELHLYF